MGIASMEIGAILGARPIDFNEINADALKKSGVELANFDKNGDKKIDDTEITELLIASKTSHYSELMKKESLEKLMGELKDCQKDNDRQSIRKKSLIGAAIGAFAGLGGFGLGVTGGISAMSGLALTGFLGLLVVGSATAAYFISKNIFKANKESTAEMLSKELNDCQKTYDKMNVVKES